MRLLDRHEHERYTKQISGFEHVSSRTVLISRELPIPSSGSRHILGALVDSANELTGISVHDIRAALIPALSAFEDEGYSSFARLHQSANRCDLLERCRNARKILGVEARRVLMGKGVLMLHCPRPCRLVEAQLLLYHALASAGWAQSSSLSVCGNVFWVTGVSGVGKTTLATEICGEMSARGYECMLLDGDVLRSLLASPATSEADALQLLNDSFSIASRLELASCYAELAFRAASCGEHVAVATVSAFHSIREVNRRRICRYFEVSMVAPFGVILERDARGIYNNRLGEGPTHLIGLDLTCESPQQPDFEVNNSGDLSNLVGSALEIIDAAVVASAQHAHKRCDC